MENYIADRLMSLPNIGPLLSKKLRQAGFFSHQQLMEAGAETCFQKLKALDENMSLYTLYALEGAITGTKRHLLNTERRIQLKTFFEFLVKGRKAA